MTIETKFNVGDKVYSIIGTDIQAIKIDKIHIYVEKYINIKYQFYDESWFPSFIDRTEDEVFSTKEELINSLK